MAEQVADHNPAVSESDAADFSSGDDVWRQLLRVSPSQLRKPSLSRQLIGGYRPEDVGRLLERAARTIEALADTVAGLEGHLAQAAPDAPEQAVGEWFVTAHRVIEGVKEEAQREAERIIAEARHEAEQAEHLRREAQAAVEDARDQATALLEAARAERERLIADSVGSAAQVRADLEAERARLDAAINDLRGVWAGRISDALARLEGMKLEIGSAPKENARVASINEENSPESLQSDVVTELRARLRDVGDAGVAKPAP